MEKSAASRDRHTGVVRGQEELKGVKEIDHKYVLKRDSTDSIIVMHTKRTNMLFDNEVEARDAFLNIHDAKEEAEFEDEGNNKEETSQKEEENKMEDKSAESRIGMKVCGKYTIVARDAVTDSYLLKGDKASGWCKQDVINKLLSGSSDVSNTQPIENPGVGEKAKGSNYYDEYTKNNGYATMVPMSPGNNALVGKASENHSLIDPDFNLSDMERELQLGVRREHEHTDDPAKALEIAIDHLAEDKNYYEKLNKVLPEYGKEEKPERIVDVERKEEPIDYEEIGKNIMFPKK